MQMENEAEMIGDDQSGSEDESVPRLGPGFQVDSLPRCTHNFFIGSGSVIMEEDEEAFATGLPVRVTTILVSETRSPATKATSNPPEADDAEEECPSRRRKGKKKRKGNWLAMRRMRLRTEQQQAPPQHPVVVPGDTFDLWEDSEEAGFVLGLYLFGKDFNALRRFLGTRGMSDLQRYYYGSFYGTAAYKRWVAARNSCSKRIVNGHHILIGWRQEEVMRRMLPELEECSRPELFETMAGFNKGELSFESYVSKIKAIAGLELLIDSIGLGCGKRDLTMGAVDPMQSNKRFELPVGKAFCDYTAMEMFRALSGGCRLSKSRAQDLFWEGIWPRLLAKGWSSEQTGKGPLVYMVPGIKRYSKRSLVKGKDYFDSISEVLNFLSTDSALLEHPDLDHDLLNKRVLGPGSSSNGLLSPGSKRKQTLWLSKGTSSFKKEDDSEDEKEGKKKKKQQQEEMKEISPAPDVSDDRRTDAAAREIISQQSEMNWSSEMNPSSSEVRVDSSFRAGDSSSGWEAGAQIFSRKRSYQESFSEISSSASGVSAVIVSPAEPRRVFILNTMIKHYLGSGKSMRLYGPNKSSSQSAYKVFVRGFEQALCRNRKGIVSFSLKFNFVVSVDQQHHPGNYYLLENGGRSNEIVVASSLAEKKKKMMKVELVEDDSSPSSSSSSEGVSCRDCGEVEGDSHKCCRRLVD